MATEEDIVDKSRRSILCKLPSDATQAEKDIALLLSVDCAQSCLFESWPHGDEDASGKHQFLHQCCKLNAAYPGGLKTYHSNAARLLHEQQIGANPFEGWTPFIPKDGESVAFSSPRFEELELLGMQEVGCLAVVLVAGGLGERLGYSGIKLQLPVDAITEICFLDFYCRWCILSKIHVIQFWFYDKSAAFFIIYQISLHISHFCNNNNNYKNN